MILDDTVYLQDLQSNVFAIDLSSGEKQWERQRGQGNIGPNGIAVSWGKVFATSSDTTFAALDMANGEELWSVNLSRMRGEGVGIQPIVFGDLVFVGTVPGTGET